jgi:enterochelin esterase-like enzyme
MRWVELNIAGEPVALHAGQLNHSTTVRGCMASLARVVASWRYRAAGSRDLRLDLLRGFCVFAMVVDHVGGASWLYGITGGNRGAVSAGEGFVFLSGLVAGLVYSRKMLRSGLTATTWALLRRARLLYVVTVAMTLGFVGLAVATDLQLWVDRGSGLGADSLAAVVIGALTLRYAYHGSDILAVYTILLCASPVVFLLLRAGHIRWVLAGSWGLWMLNALFPDMLDIWRIQNGLYFPIAAWQMLFVTGLVLGYSVVMAEQRAPIRWTAAVQAAAPYAAVAAVLLASVAWLRTANPLDVLPASSFNPTGLEDEPWATGIWDKIYLGPGRLLAFAGVAMLSYFLLTLLWRPVERVFGWLLLPLGAGSLHAYVSHLFLVVAGYNLALMGFGEPELAGLNTAAQLGLVLVVWALLRLPTSLSDLRESLARVRHARPRVARGLAGVSAALAVVVLLGSPTAFSASRMPTSAQVPAPPIFQPPVPVINGPVSMPDISPGILPPTVPGDELMVPGLTVAVEGPRSWPLRGGQLWPQAFMSPTLQRWMPYYVYLPPGYEKGDGAYPVLYLLHGYYGGFGEWAEVGVHQAADELILSGEIQPMIIVMPEGEQSYYVNHGVNGPRWGDYIAQDVVSEIDRNFRTIPTAEARAIGGLSMGGTGALHLAFNHPELFGIVGAHAPTLKWERPEDKFHFADDEYYRSVNPLVQAARLDGLENLVIMLDIGDDDPGWFTLAQLSESLEQRGLDSELVYLEGSHSAEYWIDHQWQYLPAYDRAFRGPRTAASDPLD